MLRDFITINSLFKFVSQRSQVRLERERELSALRLVGGGVGVVF